MPGGNAFREGCGFVWGGLQGCWWITRFPFFFFPMHSFFCSCLVNLFVIGHLASLDVVTTIHHQYQSDVSIIIRAMSLLPSGRCQAYKSQAICLPVGFPPRLTHCLAQYSTNKVPDTNSLPFLFTNYLYSTHSFPFVDSLSSTNRSIFQDCTFYSF